MNMILKSGDTLSSKEAIILVKIENTLSYGVENYIGNKEFNIRKKSTKVLIAVSKYIL